MTDLYINKYTDNCRVTRLRYRRDYIPTTPLGLDDSDWINIEDVNTATPIIDFDSDPDAKVRFYEGQTTVWFEFADGSDALESLGYARNTTAEPVFVVTVLPKPEPGEDLSPHGSGIQ